MAKVNPRLISLFVSPSGSSATVDRSDEVSKAVIGSAASDAEFLSFAAARTGGERDYTLNLTVAQDHASGTLLDLIWTGAGTEVPYRYAPYGNTTASATQPHYKGIAIVSEPDGDFLGGEATTSTKAVGTFEVSWALKAKPEKVIA